MTNPPDDATPGSPDPQPTELLPATPLGPADVPFADVEPVAFTPTPSTPLHYAPVFERPPRAVIEQLGYARPGTYRRPGEGHPGVMFVLGMMSPFVVGCLLSSLFSSGGEAALLIAIFLLVVVPIAMLLFRSTRMLGAGWITSIALTWLAVAALCSGMRF